MNKIIYSINLRVKEDKWNALSADQKEGVIDLLDHIDLCTAVTEKIQDVPKESFEKWLDKSIGDLWSTIEVELGDEQD